MYPITELCEQSESVHKHHTHVRQSKIFAFYEEAADLIANDISRLHNMTDRKCSGFIFENNFNEIFFDFPYLTECRQCRPTAAGPADRKTPDIRFRIEYSCICQSHLFGLHKIQFESLCRQYMVGELSLWYNRCEIH